MMFKTIGWSLMCALAIAQAVSAQDTSAAGLISQLVAPKPAAVVPAKPVEVKAPIVVAPVAAPKPAVPATTTAVLPEVIAPVVSVPVAAAPKAVSAVVVVDTNKPTVTISQPKKRGGATSFLGKTTSSTNTPQRETMITSDKIDFDNREGVILFDDHVLVDDPQFSMRSDRLLVFMEGTNDVSQVMAIGNVIFSNEMRSATCSKAVFTKKDGQVVMTGDVRMKTEGETSGEVRGRKVVIWVDDERVEVLDGASVTLPPGAFKKAADKEKKDAKVDKKKEEPPQPK
ncbi:MAG: LptA/OstA family protein [bacterium]